MRTGLSLGAPQPPDRPDTHRRVDRDPTDAAPELSLLLVEDNPADVLLVRLWLEEAGVEHELTTCLRLSQALRLTEQQSFDAVLLDLSLPDAQGLESVRTMRAARPSTALIVLTGGPENVGAEECIGEGAHDYLVKDDVNPGSLRRSIEIATARARLARMQARLAHGGRLTALGRLAAGVVHELNNPLQFVMTNLDVVAEVLSTLSTDLPPHDPLTARARDSEAALREAQRGTERVAKILAGLRQFSRPEEDPPRRVPVRDLVEQALAMTRSYAARCARVHVDIEDELYVFGHEVRLGQVLVNLLLNAADAIESTGRRDGEITIEANSSADQVWLLVGDNGCGMSDDDLGRVFAPFVSTKRDGLGLGLALSREIVEEHGGSLTASSTLDEGTVFAVRLPRAPAQDGLGDQEETVEPMTDHRLRLLVVDDEPMVLRALGRALWSHDLTLCGNGRDALRALETATVPYDAVISDLTMPELGGRGLWEEARRLDPELADRFVVLTGGPLNADDATFALRHGALTKPVTMDALQQRLLGLGKRR